MPKFKSYDYNQSAMVVINFEEQLRPGTFEYAIHRLITDKLDLSIFHPSYQNDDVGRPAYDPAILLKIILFAYSKGITSSREIQWCCETNILFKALSCDTVPHFTTIAHFVSSYPRQIEALFEQVLLVCHQQGLLGNELFAIDGCKLPSNAAKEWSGTFKELEAKRKKLQKQIHHCLKEHRKLDKKDPEQKVRAERVQQTIDTLDAAFDKVDRFLKTQAPRMGQGKRPTEIKSNITDNESAKMTTSKGTIQGYNGVAAVDKKHQVIIDAQAFGHGQEHHTLQPVLERIKTRYQDLGIRKDVYKGRSKVTVTADTGYANEANMQYLHDQRIDAYIPDNQFRSRDPKFADQKTKYGRRHQEQNVGAPSVIPASEFHFDPIQKTCICPAGESLRLQGQLDGGNGKLTLLFEGRLLQCRNCALKQRCMQKPEQADHRKGHGRQVSFIVRSRPTFTDWMKQRVDSAEGKRIYSHRMSTVEPVFANITCSKKLRHFSLRGKDKVQGQWQLFCLIHNIEKLIKYGEMAK
jgi:transposase